MIKLGLLAGISAAAFLTVGAISCGGGSSNSNTLDEGNLAATNACGNDQTCGFDVRDAYDSSNPEPQPLEEFWRDDTPHENFNIWSYEHPFLKLEYDPDFREKYGIPKDFDDMKNGKKTTVTYEVQATDNAGEYYTLGNGTYNIPFWRRTKKGDLDLKDNIKFFMFDRAFTQGSKCVTRILFTINIPGQTPIELEPLTETHGYFCSNNMTELGGYGGREITLKYDKKNDITWWHWDMLHH